MTENTKTTFELINELIIAISKILWPIIVLAIVIIFKKEIASLIKRIRKGKLFGQELELDNEINEFKKVTNKASESIAEDSNTKKDTNIETKRSDEILKSSVDAPTLGIVMLSREIKKELQHIAASSGILKDVQNKSVAYTFQVLVERKQLADSILKSVKIFWDLRNKIVHGKEIEDEKQIIRVLDIGTNLLDTLKDIPRAKYIVYKKDVDLFSDQKCENKRTDVKGVILETISPEGTHTSYNLRPTTKNYYQEKDSVAWEWSFDNQWDKTFYKDPDTGEIIKPFDRSVEFVGRPIKNL
jgi:hypothetical protein